MYFLFSTFIPVTAMQKLLTTATIWHWQSYSQVSTAIVWSLFFYISQSNVVNFTVVAGNIYSRIQQHKNYEKRITSLTFSLATFPSFFRYVRLKFATYSRLVFTVWWI